MRANVLGSRAKNLEISVDLCRTIFQLLTSEGRPRRLVAGRCSEKLGKKRAAHRIRVGGHSARCNLGLLRNALADWSALMRHRTAGSVWRRTLQMRSWLRRHDKTDGPANEPNQHPDQNRNSYPGEVCAMGQHAG